MAQAGWVWGATHIEAEVVERLELFRVMRDAMRPCAGHPNHRERPPVREHHPTTATAAAVRLTMGPVNQV